MGRAEKIFPGDVLEKLTENPKTKRKALANALECCTGTISRKLSQLVRDGVNIGFDANGVFLVTQEDAGSDKKDADYALAWENRIYNSLLMWARRGRNNKRVAIEARKRFGKELSADERKSLKQQLLVTSRVLDAIELDEELGD